VGVAAYLHIFISIITLPVCGNSFFKLPSGCGAKPTHLHPLLCTGMYYRAVFTNNNQVFQIPGKEEPLITTFATNK
jgi:hypothetical protein